MTVLGELLRKALIDKGLKMAQASRHAGQSSSYIKALIAGRIENPGILSLLAVAETAELDISAMISAIKADRGEGLLMTKEERAVLEAYRRASRAEKAAMFPKADTADKRPKGRKIK